MPQLWMIAYTPAYVNCIGVGGIRPLLPPIQVVEDIAEQAAELRAEYGIKTPDAIQIATGIFGGAAIFLTNDGKLEKVDEIEVIVLDEM